MVELYCNVQSDNGSLTEGWSDESSAGMRLLIGGKITLLANGVHDTWKVWKV